MQGGLPLPIILALLPQITAEDGGMSSLPSNVSSLTHSLTPSTLILLKDIFMYKKRYFNASPFQRLIVPLTSNVSSHLRLIKFNSLQIILSGHFLLLGLSVVYIQFCLLAK